MRKYDQETIPKPAKGRNLVNQLQPKYCITTISCDQFAIGTEVLLYSFLQHNSWFNGDINIVIADLSACNRERLSALYPINFIQASDQLISKVDVLRNHFPRLKDIHLRFYSLESFNQPDYDRVVYLDSDMFCAGDIKTLFTDKSPLLACLDGYSYEDRIAPIVQEAGLTLPLSNERYGKAFKNSFNAGVIAFSPRKLPKDHYTEMLSMLEYESWLSFDDSIFTDQMVINRYFDNQIEVVSSEYNYMIFLDSYLQFVDKLAPHQARMIHFAGKIKPWNNYHQSELLRHAPHYLPFIQQWRELLDAVRNRHKPQFSAQKLIDQFRWIEQGADHQLEKIGRLF